VNPPALPDEVWRVTIRDTVCAVLEGHRLAVWWHGGWDVHPLSANERQEVLWAWAEHGALVAAAERAARKAEEDVWLGAVRHSDDATLDRLRQARSATHDALRALGVEP